MKKRLLITGFEPFGGQTVNPAWEAVKGLRDTVGEYTLRKLRIPTVFQQAGKAVLEASAEFAPDVILCVGQAGSRGSVTPERIAINLRDARIADNAGNCPKETPIIPGGSAAYFSTVPVRAMAEAITAAGYPAAVSNTAGTFVCNEVLYTLLHHYAGTATRVGFIHVPYLPEQGSPNMLLEDIIGALEAAIGAL